MIPQEELIRIRNLFSTNLCSSLKMPFNKTGFRAKMQISSEQYQILSFLKKGGAISQTRLSEITGKDKPSVTRLLNKLEAKALVKREADATDKRIKNISITGLGIREYEKVSRITDDLIQSAMNNIDRNQLLIFNSVLNNILNNLAIKAN
jgi:DNA-binding MarR family transcriptional regulator